MYEKALAYLRAFHSRCVVPPYSSTHSLTSFFHPDDISRLGMPLYAIVEDDDEVTTSSGSERTVDSMCERLSDEFSTALSANDDENDNHDGVLYRRCHPSSSSFPRMKRTARSDCLLDLVDDRGADCDGGVGGGGDRGASSSIILSRSNVVGIESRHHDYDHFFDLCPGDDNDEHRVGVGDGGYRRSGDIRKMRKHHPGSIVFGIPWS
jgi:hypothetical protein